MKNACVVDLRSQTRVLLVLKPRQHLGTTLIALPLISDDINSKVPSAGSTYLFESSHNLWSALNDDKIHTCVRMSPHMRENVPFPPAFHLCPRGQNRKR